MNTARSGPLCWPAYGGPRGRPEDPAASSRGGDLAGGSSGGRDPLRISLARLRRSEPWKVRIGFGNFVVDALQDAAPTGETADYLCALKLEARAGGGVVVPPRMLLSALEREPRRIEARADAASALPDSGWSLDEQPAMTRIFAESVGDFLNAAVFSQASGSAVVPVLSGSAAGTYPATDIAQVDAGEITITLKQADPSRLESAVRFSAADEVRSPRVFDPLVPDLREQLRIARDKAILTLALAATPAPGNEAAIVTFASLLAKTATAIDGLAAPNLAGIRILLGVKTMRLASGSAVDGLGSVADYLRSFSAGIRATSLIPEADQELGILVRTGQRDIGSFFFGSPVLLTDRVSLASTAEIRITMRLFHKAIVLRTGGLVAIKSKTA